MYELIDQADNGRVEIFESESPEGETFYVARDEVLDKKLGTESSPEILAQAIFLQRKRSGLDTSPIEELV